MAACRNSLENIEKMNLIPILNKTSPRAHMELELDMLGVPAKLVKYVIHASKRKKKNKNFKPQAVQTAIEQFLVSSDFGG
jgi:hypothetical protein